LNYRELVRKKYLKASDFILEFGPLNGPVAKKDEFPNTYYADIRTTEEIKKLYSSNAYLESTGIKINTDDIVEIDYVIKSSYKSTFEKTKKFDSVVLSHVIEHIPDILSFFKDVESIVSENGKLIIIYPDSRYCFDHFRNGTTFVDALSLLSKGSSAGYRVFDFVFNVVNENRPEYFWEGKDLYTKLPRNNFKDSEEAYEKANRDILPEDTHFWPFSDHQFIKFIYDMDRAGMLGFEIDKFHSTKQNTQEFMVVLKRKKIRSINYKKYSKLLDITSPISRDAKMRNEIDLVTDKLNAALSENYKLNDYINKITHSKRWQYASKLANLKNKIIK